jgi:hypothetical protein
VVGARSGWEEVSILERPMQQASYLDGGIQQWRCIVKDGPRGVGVS